MAEICQLLHRCLILKQYQFEVARSWAQPLTGLPHKPSATLNPIVILDGRLTALGADTILAKMIRCNYLVYNRNFLSAQISDRAAKLIICSCNVAIGDNIGPDAA